MLMIFNVNNKMHFVELEIHLPAVFIEGEHVAFIFDAGDGISVPVSRGEDLIGCVSWLAPAFCVLWPVVPH